VSKQRENTQIYQQLRMVQLEKDNNDKLYTRIFTSSKKDKVRPRTLRKASPTKTRTTYTPSSSTPTPLISGTCSKWHPNDRLSRF
jgi:hypothetical protein